MTKLGRGPARRKFGWSRYNARSRSHEEAHGTQTGQWSRRQAGRAGTYLQNTERQPPRRPLRSKARRLVADGVRPAGRARPREAVPGALGPGGLYRFGPCTRQLETVLGQRPRARRTFDPRPEDGGGAVG